jgi:excinuclease ABC subunit C
MVSRIERVEAAVCDSEHEAAWLERNLLEHAKPRWNRAIGGLETCVYIGLNRKLEVRHEPTGSGQVFGPYLGGDKVRLAVSGLHRVLPLAYAGERLNGSDRDMARVRGVVPGSREELSAAVVAVLTRDEAAGARVRRELRERRDAAAAALAFELAARIHAELEALDWVLAEQKVTRSDNPTDVDIHGWSTGLLVTFHLRGGRIRSWSQRRCDGPAAQPLINATPVEWRPFADRNAQLAARLLALRAN